MRSKTRRSTRCLVVAVVTLVSCSAGEEPALDRCERARDHLVALHAAANPEHTEVIRGAMGPEFVDTCFRSMSEQHTSCILEAKTATSAVACAATSAGGAP